VAATRLLDTCPKVMFSSAAGYKAETDCPLFLVVRAGADVIVPEAGLSSCSQPFLLRADSPPTTVLCLSKDLTDVEHVENVGGMTRPITSCARLGPIVGGS